jgi:hypothetical protein
MLLRSQANTAEVRALHGLCRDLEQRGQQPRNGSSGS